MHPITSTHLTAVRHQDYEAVARRHHAGRLDHTPRARSARTWSATRPGWLAQLAPARWRVRRTAAAGPVSC